MSSTVTLSANMLQFTVALLLLLLTRLGDALSVQPTTTLLLPAAVPQAADAFAVPVVSLEPVVVNYTRHLSMHDVDEIALFSSLSYDDGADSASPSLTLVHSLHLKRPSTESDAPLVVHNVSFTQSAESPADFAHPACVSHGLQQHGLRLTDCHVLPAELQPTERVSLLLSYRPTPTAVPSTYYLLLHTSEALYITPLQLILPLSLTAYQRADFVSPTVRSPVSSTVGMLCSLLLSLPLLGCLVVSILLFAAQTGQIHSTSVAAVLHPLPLLPSMHAMLTPYLYPLETATQIKPSAAPQLPPPTANTALATAQHQPSPIHALLRRKTAAASSSSSAQTTSTTSAVSSPTVSSLTTSIRVQPTELAAIDSAPSSPLAAPSIDLPNSALDLTQITFHHHKSLSVGTGEAMMKEVERALRRKRRASKQSTEAVVGEEQKAAEVDGVGGPDIVSPPQTRRTMSVGSSGPLFFRFDRITKEVDERSSDGSRVGSESSSSTNNSNSDSEEERPTDSSRQSTSEQSSQHSVAVVHTAPSTSKPLDASAQPFTPRSALATHTASVLTQPPTAQPMLQASHPARPAPTSYTPRASFYSSQRASASPRSLHGSGSSTDAPSPRTHQMYEGKERRTSQQLPPATSFAGVPLASTYPSYISPRHSAPPQRSLYPPTVNPRHTTFHSQHQPLQQQQQQHIQPRHFSATFRSTTPSAPLGYPSPRNSTLSASLSYSPPLSAFSGFTPSQPQQPQQPIIVYDHTDTITYSPSASSPVQRPKLPHLILPKSPDSTPSLAPISPQAIRTSVSPSHRFLHVGGAGTVRDSKWTASSERESSDWPDTHPPPHRRQLTPFSISLSPALKRGNDESLYEISEEDGEQQPASIWSTVRSFTNAAANVTNNAAVFPYHSYPTRTTLAATSASSWSSPTSPSSHTFPLPSLSSSTASSPATSPLLTGGDTVADDEDLMDLRAMEETGKGGSVVDGVRDVRDEDDVSGLADALGALGRARALHSIQLSIAQSRSAATHTVEADKENVQHRVSGGKGRPGGGQASVYG